jgi:hypothetical protein
MLTREQLHAFLCMRKRKDTLFSAMPRDVIHYISQTSMASFSENSEIAKLLHHIAYGDLQSAKAMLEVNPRLVLQAGHTETPSGLKVLHTTPLECALGAGDPEMAKMIMPYFDSDKISGGAKVRETQYTRYRQYIVDMLNPEINPPYDFTLLIETLMTATSKDVWAALKRDMTHHSLLRDVLEQFRKDFTPGNITRGMHFNYQHLLHAFEVYDQQYVHFSKHSNYLNLRLLCCQIIGFIQRSLPAIDRMVFAQSLFEVVNNGEIKRSFKFKYSTGDFSDTGGDQSRSGLGFEYFAGGSRCHAREGSEGGGHACLEKLWRDKHFKLAELIPPQREKKTSLCIIS